MGEVKPPRTQMYRYLFPHFKPDWGFGFIRRGSPGVVQAALTRLELFLGARNSLNSISIERGIRCVRDIWRSLEENDVIVLETGKPNSQPARQVLILDGVNFTKQDPISNKFGAEA